MVAILDAVFDNHRIAYHRLEAVIRHIIDLGIHITQGNGIEVASGFKTRHFVAVHEDSGQVGTVTRLSLHGHHISACLACLGMHSDLRRISEREHRCALDCLVCFTRYISDRRHLRRRLFVRRRRQYDRVIQRIRMKTAQQHAVAGDGAQRAVIAMRAVYNHLVRLLVRPVCSRHLGGVDHAVALLFLRRGHLLHFLQRFHRQPYGGVGLDRIFVLQFVEVFERVAVEQDSA